MRIVCLLAVTIGFGTFGCGSVSNADPDAGVIDAPPDPCETNTCECETDSDCEDFEVCDTTSTPGRLCACAPTYEDSGGGCAFAGAPGDPGFQQPDVWVSSNALRAAVDVTALGDIDTGVGLIGPLGDCFLDSFTQTFEMPPIERADAFAVDVNYRQDLGGGFFDETGLSVSIGGAWNHLPNSNTFQSASFCLGAAGYGGDVEFRVTATNQPRFNCDGTPTTSTIIDRFAIRKALADECPAVGLALNGDAENDAGWTFQNTGDGASAFAGNVGVGNSRGISLSTQTRCSSASATTKISLPLDGAVPGQAIELFAQGSGGLVELKLGGRSVSRFAPNGIRRVCVPDWAKGSAQSVTLALTQVHSTGSCAPAFVRNVAIDAVSVVSDAGCGDIAQDVDNGFEVAYGAAGLAPNWAVSDGAVNGTLAPATILISPTEARSGNGSLRVSATNICNDSTARKDIIIPPAAGGAGPAIKAFVSVPNAPSGNAGLRFVRATSDPTIAEATEGVGYGELVLCVPSIYSGRPLTVEAFASGGGGGCADIPAETSFVDDITIGTDASCPAP